MWRLECSCLALLLAWPAVAPGQVYENDLPLDHDAIRYWWAEEDNRLSRLIDRVERGETVLEFQPDAFGYLTSLLDALEIDVASQTLVFSKTSLQRARISPRLPRAIYFNDDVAVGFVPGGDAIEIAALDPSLGAAFYTLDARDASHARFDRPKLCLACHRGAATLGVAGVYVGSVLTSTSGRPSFRGSIVSDHRTSFDERWGGWYVNGASDVAHRGNAFATSPQDPAASGLDAILGLASVAPQYDAGFYPTPTSDVVALMTLEHQTQMANVLTRASWEYRIDGEVSEKRIEEIVSYMRFEDEAPLPKPIETPSSFTETFAARGPKDRRGRSLRDLELTTRLFRYPMSYMIYSELFDALPDDIRARIARALTRDAPPDVLDILRDTKPGVLE